MNGPSEIFTVGHSTYQLEHFMGLLKKYSITAVADVRSLPSSRFAPQFNRPALERELARIGLTYVFLGAELGADMARYRRGDTQYLDRLNDLDAQRGIQRVLEGSREFRVALMCTEKDPMECHRTLLVSEMLVHQGARVTHILEDGSQRSHTELIDQLIIEMGTNQGAFNFDLPDELETDPRTKAINKKELEIIKKQQIKIDQREGTEPW